MQITEHWHDNMMVTGKWSMLTAAPILSPEFK